jgi:acyl transferase domain-containing protein
MKGLKLKPPKIPYLSNVTGDWITPEQAQDPKYWGEHLCQPVRFAEGVRQLLQQPGRVLVEVGPGQTLCAWAMQQPEIEDATELMALPSLRHSFEQQSDTSFILNTLGRLWLAGIPIEWPAFYAQECRYRVSLPAYSFDLQRCWIEAPAVRASHLDTVSTVHDSGWVEGNEEGNAKELDQTVSRRFVPTPYVAARHELEEKLAQVWRRVLNDQQVGIYDNFFALGGDSIRATQLVTRVSETFQATISLRDIFNSPTVADLAVIIVQRQAEQADAGVLAQVLKEIKQLP